MAIVHQEATFVEDSGASGTTYQADFFIPANAVIEKIHTFMVHPWNDSAGGSLACGFNGTGSPNLTIQNLHDSAGEEGGGVQSPSTATGDRTFSFFVTGLNNDGSLGRTRVGVFYSTTDVPSVPVVHS
jgi:hypothetical protein